MDQIGVFSPEQARMLWQDYLRRQQLPAQLTQHFPNRRQIEPESTHRVFVKNTSDEPIPPYGCMRVTGTIVVGERTLLQVEQPSSTDGEFLFNSQFEIPVEAAATETTQAQSGIGWAYRYGLVIMLGDAPTSVGVSYTPVVGSWEVEEGAGPLVVFGEHEASDRALIGRFGAGKASMAVILDAALAAASNSKLTPTSCLATILTWDDVLNKYEESPEQVTVWNHSETASHAINTFGWAKHLDGHYWFFGDCEAMNDREAT